VLFENAPLCVFELDMTQTTPRIIRANRRSERVYGWAALINPSLAVKLLDEFRRLSQAADEAEDTHNLTQGEMDVLRLVAQGTDNRAVAEQLALSERTVANRLSAIYEKLDVNNRTQAALVALRCG
jgi:DNA-binding NarL/FixJ family response regulator